MARDPQSARFTDRDFGLAANRERQDWRGVAKIGMGENRAKQNPRIGDSVCISEARSRAKVAAMDRELHSEATVAPTLSAVLYATYILPHLPYYRLYD